MSPTSSYTHVNWALTGTAGALTIGRYAIRYVNSRRFFWDDLVHLCALVVLIAHGGTDQLSLNSKARIKTAADSKPRPSQTYLLGLYEHNERLSSVNNCFLYLVFWIVKLSFLMLYRFLFQSSTPFKKAWWVVLAFTVVTFWVPIAGVLSTCAGADTVADYKACDGQTHGRVIKLEYSCVVNIVSDLAIMALPFWMLKDLKIAMSQKLGLAFIFSFAIVCVALDIVRVVEAVSQNQALYTVIEINLVVVISCLPTYRSLLSIRQRKKPQQSHPWRSLEQGNYWRSHEGDNHPLRRGKSSDFEVEMSAKSIHITQALDISNAARDLDPLDTTSKPARAASSSTVRTQAFS